MLDFSGGLVGMAWINHGESKGECMRREDKSQRLIDSKWNFLQNPIPYYFGSFNTNYIIFRNVKFFNKCFPQITKTCEGKYRIFKEYSLLK
jgi:hypothetical protein